MSSKYNNNKKHGNLFKNWLCPSFLLLPKKSELPKLWGGCSPPRPPGPYAYGFQKDDRLIAGYGAYTRSSNDKALTCTLGIFFPY